MVLFLQSPLSSCVVRKSMYMSGNDVRTNLFTVELIYRTNKADVTIVFAV